MSAEFIAGWNSLQFQNAVACKKNGFEVTWENLPRALALIHSELSEALEADRSGNPPDKHCPNFSSVEVELADAIIRIMNINHCLGLNIPKAVIEKLDFNDTRPFRHGKKY